jgi:hypothetical protein
VAAASSVRDDDPRFPGRLAALAWETKVHEQANDLSPILGYLRVGAIVRAAAEPVGTSGCKGGWYAIAPLGFVCADSSNATTDVDNPLARALARRPDTSERLPYMYGIVRRPGPIYARLPTRAEAESAEPGLESRMGDWLANPNDDGASFRTDYWMRGKNEPAPSPLALWNESKTREVPFYLDGDRFPPGNVSGLAKGDALVVGTTKNHNGFAVLDTAVRDGRRYGITTDLLVFPVDRMRPIEGSAFHGYEIPKDIDFPFAIIRRDGASLYAFKGKKLSKVRDVERRAALKLTGKQKFFGGTPDQAAADKPGAKRLYFETTDGLWVSDLYASRLDGAKRMPKWGKEGERWLDVSIARQTIVAYDGMRAVYATLVSTGEAGLEDPATTKSTKRGIFRNHTKNLTTTMSSDVIGEQFELRDIPYVQYFEEGYALHAAYWHDDFGTPRSHGCINLSPEDARWLFEWTEPQLPKGWHGVRKALRGSVVFVHP